jgi:hypothetical protein
MVPRINSEVGKIGFTTDVRLVLSNRLQPADRFMDVTLQKMVIKLMVLLLYLNPLYLYI